MIPIDPRDPRPIYLQIKEGLCRLILSGAVKTGERLPSVGKGSFAAALAEVDAGRRSAKEKEFRAAAQELLRLGTPKGDLVAILDELEQEVNYA